MDILHLCPANVATGGTEGIHHFIDELNKCGANAKILYVGSDLSSPQPEVYAKQYNCPYITEFPQGYEGVVIFPEIWANQTLEAKYRKCQTVVNWQGIDVYYWHTPIIKRNEFLQRQDTIHVIMSEYGMDYLSTMMGLHPMKISDCINDAYLQDFEVEYERQNFVLYNPSPAKMTQFQEVVMARCTTEYGIKFKPLEGYTQEQLIDLFRHSKLYIDFGVFSGRERLPREAVMCGCCILTSNKGTAKYYDDNSILDKYKICDISDAMNKVRYILNNYGLCKPDFDEYRRLLRKDKELYPQQVKEFYERLKDGKRS